MDNVIILRFITLTIFSLMFAIGLNYSFEQLTFLRSRPALLGFYLAHRAREAAFFGGQRCRFCPPCKEISL